MTRPVRRRLPPPALLAVASLLPQLAAAKPLGSESTGFYIDDGRLLDANGEPFVFRGVNNGHAWHDNPEQGFAALEALDNIAGFGFNSVRVVWGVSQYPGGPATSDAVLEDIIVRAIDNDLVPVIELHDFTGGTASSDVQAAASWWADRAWLMNKYEREVVVNIANEWGRRGAVSDEQFRDAYKSAITTVRNAGIRNTLIIDANQWAQELGPVRRYGSELYEHDPQRNLGFSVHYYCEFGVDPQRIEDELAWSRDAGLYLMVGEFAAEHADYARGGVCDVQERAITRLAERYDIGHFWWAWISSGSRGVSFSLANGWEASGRADLTPAGADLIYDDPNGIERTSRPASIFGDPAEDPPPSEGPSEPAPSEPAPGDPDGDAPAIDPGRYYALRDGYRGHNVSESSTDDGSSAFQVVPGDGWAQQWRFLAAGGDSFRICNRWSEQCLSETDTAEWSELRVSAYDEAKEAQRWRLQWLPQQGGYRLANLWSGQVLTSGAEPDTPLYLAEPRSDWSSQAFSLD